MRPQFDLMISFDRGQMHGTITRSSTGDEVELRDDECARLLDALAVSESRVDTLRHFFILNNTARNSLEIVSQPAAEFAQIGAPRPSADDWRL